MAESGLILFFGLLLLAVPIVAAVLAVAALKRANGRAAASLEARIAWLESQLGSIHQKLDALEKEKIAPPVPRAPVAPVPDPASVPAPPAPARMPAEAPARRMALEQRIGARWATWVGVVSLIITAGLLLRWVFERNLIGPAARVGLGVGTGLALLAAGLGIRRRNLPFLSDGLAGGGLAILYLSLFAARDLYGFLGTGSAFSLMSVVTALGIAIAVFTDREATAVLAVLGGLLTPILVSSQHPDERLLLGYLAVLDALVLGAASRRSWKGLNRLSWAGSVLLFLPILVKTPASQQPVARLALLTVLFGLYLAVPLVQSWIERRRVAALDLALVIGNAAAYFAAVYVTLETWRPGLEGAWALALGVVYVAVARRHKLTVPEDDPTVGLHLGLAVVLATIAFPLALDGPWVTMAWAALGTVCVFLAARRVDSKAALWGGLVVLGMAVLRAAALDPLWYRNRTPVWNVAYAVHLLVVAALVLAGWLAIRPRESTAGVSFSGESARSALWFAAAGLLAVLFWREPPGLYPAVLLTLETIALAWLARAQGDPALVAAAPTLAGLALLRLFVQDSGLARAAAAHLWNAPLLVRLAACAAIAVAGRLLCASASPEAPALGRFLRGLSGAALLATLSVGWVLHQDVAIDTARAAGDLDAAKLLQWKLQVGLSVLWTLYAATALGWGFARSVASVRYAALALFGIVVAKVFLVDLAELQAIYRILSFFVLGLVLLGVSYLYQRMKPASGAAG